MTKFVKRKTEKGFTLVELAIVLVIIGIILGGIIKGQEIIANAKIKRAYAAQKEISAAIYTYYDRYGFYPGDDPNGATKWTGITLAGAGNEGNGLIGALAATTSADFACTATGTEQCNLWSELRQAGIISGSGFTNPTHPYGGAIAVSYFNMPLGTPLLQNWIHMNNIPYDVAQSIDQQFDDGDAKTGTIRGVTDYTTATTGVFQVGFKM
jgi:prepilin-type N-terminal cleavage/methylation domain-containing protein